MNETQRPASPGDEKHDDLDPSLDEDQEEVEGSDDPEQGSEVDQLDEDPAYDPDDQGLKGIKGG